MNLRRPQLGFVAALYVAFIGAVVAQQQFIFIQYTSTKKCGDPIYLAQAARAGRCITQGFNSVIYDCPNRTVTTWNGPFGCTGNPSNFSSLSACTDGYNYECINEDQIEAKLGSTPGQRVFTSSAYGDSNNCTTSTSPYLISTFFGGCWTVGSQAGFAFCSGGTAFQKFCQPGCGTCFGDDVIASTNCTGSGFTRTICNDPAPKSTAATTIVFPAIIYMIAAIFVSLL